jgi:nicotinamidase-related amidase
MPITQLDPQTALIVVDLQKGIVAMPTAESAADVVRQAGRLAEAFRRHNLPVVLVKVDGAAPGRSEMGRRLPDPLPDGWSDLAPELKQHSSDHVVTKQTWGAFTNTDLESYLRGRGVTQVVMSGISTSAGVESTARFAQELGFNVSFALDAMTDMSADAHTNSAIRIFPRIGETGSTAAVLAELDRRHGAA